MLINDNLIVTSNPSGYNGAVASKRDHITQLDQGSGNVTTGVLFRIHPEITQGKTYIFTCYIRSNAKIAFDYNYLMHDRAASNDNVGGAGFYNEVGQWQKITKTFTPKTASDAVSFLLGIDKRNAQNADFTALEIKLPKLELGEDSTLWISNVKDLPEKDQKLCPIKGNYVEIYPL